MKEIRIRIKENEVVATNGEFTVKLKLTEEFNEENACMYALMRLFSMMGNEGDEVLRS